jgi:hypothetical protein
LTSSLRARAASRASLSILAVALLTTACSDANAPKPLGNDVTVTIVPVADSVFEGDVVHLTANVVDRSGTAVASPSVVWSVSDASLAEVSPDGILTLRKPGTVRISARSNDAVGTYDLGVGRLVVKFVVPIPSTYHLGRGDIVPVLVQSYDQRARVIEGRTATFATDDSSVAIVSSPGLIIARGAGTTHIRATVEGVTGSVSLTVAIADTTFALDQFNGHALPFLIAADSVMNLGVPEFHEVYIDRGKFVLSGLAQLRYQVEIDFTEYAVFNDNGVVRREFRRTGKEFDRGIVDNATGGHLAMTSEFISPLTHTADLLADGYLVHFRIPGDDEIWHVKYKKQ